MVKFILVLFSFVSIIAGAAESRVDLKTCKIAYTKVAIACAENDCIAPIGVEPTPIQIWWYSSQFEDVQQCMRAFARAIGENPEGS